MLVTPLVDASNRRLVNGAVTRPNSMLMKELLEGNCAILCCASLIFVALGVVLALAAALVVGDGALVVALILVSLIAAPAVAPCAAPSAITVLDVTPAMQIRE